MAAKFCHGESYSCRLGERLLTSDSKDKISRLDLMSSCAAFRPSPFRSEERLSQWSPLSSTGIRADMTLLFDF